MTDQAPLDHEWSAIETYLGEMENDDFGNLHAFVNSLVARSEQGQELLASEGLSNDSLSILAMQMFAAGVLYQFGQEDESELGHTSDDGWAHIPPHLTAKLVPFLLEQMS